MTSTFGLNGWEEEPLCLFHCSLEQALLLSHTARCFALAPVEGRCSERSWAPASSSMREGTGLCVTALLPRRQRSLEHLSFSLCIHHTGASWRLNALYKARICSLLSSALSLCCGYIPSGQCRALMGPFLLWVELDRSQQQQAAVFSQVPLVPVPPGFCHPWCRDTFALHASMLWSNILHHILRAAFWVQSYRLRGLFPENNICLKP